MISIMCAETFFKNFKVSCGGVHRKKKEKKKYTARKRKEEAKAAHYKILHGAFCVKCHVLHKCDLFG